MSFSLWLSSSHWEIHMYNSFLATHVLSQLSKKLFQSMLSFQPAIRGHSTFSLALAQPGGWWVVKGPPQICLFAGFILICAHNSTSASAVGLLTHSAPASHLLSTVSLAHSGALPGLPQTAV